MAPRLKRLKLDSRPSSPSLSDDGSSGPSSTIHFRHTELPTPSSSRPSRSTYLPAPASPTKPSIRHKDYWNHHGPPSANEDGYPFMDPAYIHQLDVNEPGPPKARNRTASDWPMQEWLRERDLFLAELLRLDGRGDYAAINICSQCNRRTPDIRCKDCHGGQLFCSECTRARHEYHPLHRVERWVGSHFVRTSLKALGLRVQLGHPVGEICNLPVPAFNNDFVVLDDHGLHDVAVDFCGCTKIKDHTVQLLRCGWYPATVGVPKTAATFRLLERFHLLTCESKASAFEFYHSLARETDNVSTYNVKDRYTSFLRMVRQWRHLKMLKRAGRGHDPGGAMATRGGELALLCPACPQPGKNLPADWKDVPASEMWLYSLFIGLDANFRLKRKIVSNELSDPSLSKGWGYFVDEVPFKEHLKQNWDQPVERSTCNQHHAVKDANTKESAGLAATGAGTVDCTRHNLKRPMAVGDLQKGEKYINMDYLFLSSLSYTDLLLIIVSYDIVCQWAINLWKRMKTYQPHLHLDTTDRKFVFLVPKFHLPAHVSRCQTAFSFNFTPHVGQTDGEAPERGWADINPVASSTREMGPGSHRDTLDDHFGDWNWKKIVAFGPGLLRKLKIAVPAKNEHEWVLREMENSLPVSAVAMWREQVEQWERDNKQTNPFVVTVKTVTQQDVRLALAQQEAEEIAKGDIEEMHDNVTASMMITAGLDLEQQQKRLRRDQARITGPSATTLQLAKLQERTNALHRKITAWKKIQELYMPIAARQRALDDQLADEDVEVPAYDIALYLPSQLPAQSRKRCPPKLLEYEFRLREAEAYESLDELRQHLRLRSYEWNYKKRHTVGQSAQTRAQNLIARVESKVNASASKYTDARNAMSDLGTLLHIQPTWQRTLRRLQKEDIRHLSEANDGDTEGRRTPSWIWMTEGVICEDSDDLGLQEALRIEWCKARARAMRWSEEVTLLMEEMRRVKQFLSWQADWWDEKACRHDDLEPAQKEGVVAYARRQAAMRREMRARFEVQWRHAAEWVALGEVDNEDSEEM